MNYRHEWTLALSEMFPDQYDESFVPVYYAGCSDYSSCAWVYILEKDSKFYTLEYCYSPEASNEEAVWDLEEVSLENVMELVEYWNGFED